MRTANKCSIKTKIGEDVGDVSSPEHCRHNEMILNHGSAREADGDGNVRCSAYGMPLQAINAAKGVS